MIDDPEQLDDEDEDEDEDDDDEGVEAQAAPAAPPPPAQPPAQSRPAAMTVERPSGGGMIPRRIEMPIGLWNEVLELSREGGTDHRDTLLALLDLGIQAQSEERFKPRYVALEGKLLERVSKAASVTSGQTPESMLAHLVDLGLQARAAQRPGKAGPDPPGVRVRVDLLPGVRRLAETFMPDVPGVGDTLSLQADSYTVIQRAWTVNRGATTCYLRVKSLGGGT